MKTKTRGRAIEVLLIEDDLADAGLTIRALRSGGIEHRLTLVRDGEEALEFLQRAGKFKAAPRPDLILLDLRLPKKDGLEVLEEIKSDGDLAEIPVVVLTVSRSNEDILRSHELKVDGYLTKPVRLHEFVTLIHELKSRMPANVILPAV